MSKLIFSVLISVYYNESISYFKKSLDSILYQTLLPAEVVLVKDGILTDDLNCIVKEYSQKYPILKVISLPVNQGLGKALNEGLKHCSYDLVARMDTDDIAKPDRFEKQIRVFQEHPELDVVGAWIDEFEETTSNIISTRKLPEVHDDICQ
ncbi:glycosyltransferase, partial [Bacteroides thetaiotaomicron]